MLSLSRCLWSLVFLLSRSNATLIVGVPIVCRVFYFDLSIFCRRFIYCVALYTAVTRPLVYSCPPQLPT